MYENSQIIDLYFQNDDIISRSLSAELMKLESKYKDKFIGKSLEIELCKGEKVKHDMERIWKNEESYVCYIRCSIFNLTFKQR